MDIKKKNITTEQNNKKELIICFVLLILIIAACFKVLFPMTMPNNGKVITTESGARITTHSQEQCVVEYADGSAAMYTATNTEGVWKKSMALRGSMPDTLTFNYKSIGDDKVNRIFRYTHELTIDDCFQASSNIMGMSLDDAKAVLQKYGTVFNISQETYPEIMTGGIRYGLNVMDAENQTAVTAYADENGNIDSLQFTVSNKSAAMITDKILKLKNIEPKCKNAQNFKYDATNQVFTDTNEFVDVLYLKDGTFSVKYDLTLGNYVIFEIRTYGSMNQGFHGAFLPDRENVYAENIVNETTKTDTVEGGNPIEQ